MKWRSRYWVFKRAPACRQAGLLAPLSMAFALSIAAPLRAAEGLSTEFADVMVDNIPLGVAYKVIGPGLKGLALRNLGDKMVRVQVDALTPSAAQLRRGAAPIPDVSWIQIHPTVVEVAPRTERECEILVTVPAQKKFRKRHYQVMLWSHGVPTGEKGMTVSAGLLSRLQFKTGS
jgi:hypothetical protein